MCTNSVFLLASGASDTLLMLLFIFLNFFFWIWPQVFGKDVLDGRVRQLWYGNVQLRMFLEALAITIVYTILELFVFHTVDDGVVTHLAGGEVVASWTRILSHFLIATVFLSITFWIGIIRIYLTSVQLGIKLRVIGILCGWIFPVNLIVLAIMLKKTGDEVRFENEKALMNLERKDQQICATKYPVLLLHGVFFRDFKYLDYWGRVPKELIMNGARIFYGEQQSAGSVSSCGDEVSRKILEICKLTGAEKVNIIAHSKGGLDARSAMCDPEVARHVASLTTINTPHRGCEFADYLLGKAPEKLKNTVAGAYNSALKKVGDYAPDFIGACRDLTHEACAEFNQRVKDPEGVYIQSYGSLLKNHRGGRFPLNLTYGFVGLFDGGNDGLVGEGSFAWGSDFHLLTAPGKRGISHGDVIDLNRENIPGYDVREFYVQLVADLKKKGF
ncbi:MAG: triacylglycerol lipase [Lachnospiraceae bacterium]|nr:triacylglycerol lipase [Lachnospiraceae bacterium]